MCDWCRRGSRLFEGRWRVVGWYQLATKIYIFVCLNWTSFAPKKLTKDELEPVTVKSLTMPQKRKKISTKTDAVILSTLTLFQISNFYEWLIWLIMIVVLHRKHISQYLTSHVFSSGPANKLNCTAADLYGHDFEVLLGGSICPDNNCELHS